MSLSKKIHIYYAGFYHRSGGVYSHVLNLKKGLEDMGYQVRVITLDSLPLPLRYLPHVCFKIGNFVNFPLGYLYKQGLIKYLYKVFFGSRADIEIFEDIYTYWKSEIPSVVVIHALWSDNLQAFTVSHRERVALEKNEVRIMNAIKSNIITVSEPYQQFLLSRLKPLGLRKNIDIVELGVDIGTFSSKENNNKSMIFTGSLEPRKNLIFLLRVFRALQLKDAYSLTIVGDGVQKRELLEFVKRYAIDSVTFLGRLSHEEVREELVKHQYYIHTSQKESFSFSLLEAKLCGLTTIAYSHLEVPETFIDIKIDRFEVDLWVDKIHHFTQQKCCFDKERFSYERMTEKTLERLV